MFCAKCGAAVPEGGRFCNHCGQAVGELPSAPTIAQAGQPSPDAPTSGKAVAALITGIIGLLLFPVAIAAIILGHISRSEIRKSNGQLQGDGMATAGLVMGYGAFAVIPLILILAAIAIPNLLRARIAANESSAVASIRSIHVAELRYRMQHPDEGFTCQLSNLATGGGSGFEDIADSGQKNGYRFALENCASEGGEQKYQLVAVPLVRNSTGVRTFCSDETGVIKSGDGETADACLDSGAPLSFGLERGLHKRRGQPHLYQAASEAMQPQM